MTRPAITEEQRTVAVVTLANAIRKERGLRVRAADARLVSTLLSTINPGGRAESSAQYVRGMRDLLAVLFEGGRSVADACYEAAIVEADGATASRAAGEP